MVKRINTERECVFGRVVAHIKYYSTNVRLLSCTKSEQLSLFINETQAKNL